MHVDLCWQFKWAWICDSICKFMSPTQPAEKWVSLSTNLVFQFQNTCNICAVFLCHHSISQQGYLKTTLCRIPASMSSISWGHLISHIRDSFIYLKWYRRETWTYLILQDPDSKYTQAGHSNKHRDDIFSQTVLPSPLTSTKDFWVYCPSLFVKLYLSRYFLLPSSF